MTTLRTRTMAALLLIVAILLGALLIMPPLAVAYGEAGERYRLQQRLVLALRSQAEVARRQPNDLAAMAGWMLPSGSDSAAIAALQERLANLLRDAGATAASVEVLPAVALGGLRQIGIRAQLAADVNGLAAILQGVEDGRPALVVGALNVRARTVRAIGTSNPLDIEIEVYGFKAEDSR